MLPPNCSILVSGSSTHPQPSSFPLPPHRLKSHIVLLVLHFYFKMHLASTLHPAQASIISSQACGSLPSIYCFSISSPISLQHMLPRWPRGSSWAAEVSAASIWLSWMLPHSVRTLPLKIQPPHCEQPEPHGGPHDEVLVHRPTQPAFEASLPASHWHHSF